MREQYRYDYLDRTEMLQYMRHWPVATQIKSIPVYCLITKIWLAYFQFWVHFSLPLPDKVSNKNIKRLVQKFFFRLDDIFVVNIFVVLFVKLKQIKIKSVLTKITVVTHNILIEKNVNFIIE